MHFPSQFPAGNFFSRERDGKLEIAFPDFGKGNGIFQWEVKGNLRLVFLGIVGNGNFRSPLFWTDSVLRIWKNLGRPTSWSVCERLDGEHVASEASINSGSQSSQAGSSGIWRSESKKCWINLNQILNWTIFFTSSQFPFPPIPRKSNLKFSFPSRWKITFPFPSRKTGMCCC